VSFLVDANVLSDGTKPNPSPKAIDWLLRHQPEVAVDPIILGEIQFGILILPEGKRRRRLEKWFERGVSLIHCLPWDAETGLRWARLLADLRTAGHTMSLKDSMIAATAQRHDLTVATRNVYDFRHAGLSLVNPFE
jgi:hypothetical protein